MKRSIFCGRLKSSGKSSDKSSGKIYKIGSSQVVEEYLTDSETWLINNQPLKSGETELPGIGATVPKSVFNNCL